MSIDEMKLEQYMGQLVGYMTGGALCFGMWLGDELGFYRALAQFGPLSSDQLAEKTSTQPRLVREWLDGQVAGRLASYDPATQQYALSAEATAALADDSSPVFVARGMNTLASMFLDAQQIASAFRGDGALRWGDHHPCLFLGTEWFFRTGYRAYLPAWISALDGMDAKLRDGATVADIGCGHGASAVVIAQTYPNAAVTGFDYHPPSIDTARERAEQAGVTQRASFAVADALGYPGRYDMICFFDCLHDMGDPVGAARHAREHLNPDGTVLLVEPFALDDRTENLTANPMAALLYTASSAICTPNSLSQPAGLGLGAQAGEATLRQIFQDAGYTRFRRAAQTPMNLVLEARP
ncbi:MAG TPA: class I SAM-dependent methyltransferase [Pseudonocardia sp.]|jgi:2-polyprenyl-3-methyl-5-hydroxy-6-metoxy-1,4-benzoquinol methylase